MSLLYHKLTNSCFRTLHPASQDYSFANEPRKPNVCFAAIVIKFAVRQKSASSFLALLCSLYYIAHESLSVYKKTQVRQTTESTGENLSYLKYETYNLPTAIVSNTLDYGKFDILDTTQYMKNTLGVWKALDFQFDAIFTGFIVSKEQTQMITDFCCENADKFKGLPLETCLEVLDE